MINVCFCFTDDTSHYAKFAGTAMLSLFENISSSESVTVHILHDNTLTDDNRNKFSYLADRYNQAVNFYNVDELCADKLAEMFEIFPNINKARFNKAIFYKFLIPQVLPSNIAKAIYLESNTIINIDISELDSIELGDKIIGAVPVLSDGLNVYIQDKIVLDGFVKQEDYFNSGVLLMNLNLLRNEAANIISGMKFISEHKYFYFLDQAILNYCFADNTVKLSAKFNQFVKWSRREKASVEKKIYSYAEYALQLDTKDPFNLLWIEYFLKTPWFNAAALGRLHDGFQQIHTSLKKSMANISALVSGKERAFCVVPGYVKELKKVFHIRNNEEIIPLENQTSLQQLISSMKKSQGKKIFIITAQNFPFNVLAKAGFVFGKDYLNGLEFLSAEQGVALNSYPLLREM